MFVEIFLVLVAGIFSLLYYIAKRNKREKIDLHGKHVVVTGGSSGIGWDLCIESFKQGAHVSIVARDKKKLNQIKEELESIKKKNETLSTQIVQIESIDISKNYDETKAAIDRLVSNAGPVDILINNAGIFKCVEFSETPAKDFEDMMRINYLGSVYCTKAVVDSMKKRKFGRIVFVSSQAGQIGIFGYTAYSSTKFALRGLAECLQMELKPYSIYVTLAYPPDTDTPGLKLENLHKPEETRLIAESSGLCSSKEVSDHIIYSLKRGSFSCSFGVNGFLLTTLTCGAAPITTLKEAFLQLSTLPLCRFIVLGLLLHFEMIVKSCFKKKQAAK